MPRRRPRACLEAETLAFKVVAELLRYIEDLVLEVRALRTGADSRIQSLTDLNKVEQILRMLRGYRQTFRDDERQLRLTLDVPKVRGQTPLGKLLATGIAELLQAGMPPEMILNWLRVRLSDGRRSPKAVETRARRALKAGVSEQNTRTNSLR